MVRQHIALREKRTNSYCCSQTHSNHLQCICRKAQPQATANAFFDDWINIYLAKEDYPGVFPPQIAQDVLGSQRRSNQMGG